MIDRSGEAPNGDWLCQATDSECPGCAANGWAIRVVDDVAYTMEHAAIPFRFDRKTCESVVELVRESLR